MSTEKKIEIISSSINDAMLIQNFRDTILTKIFEIKRASLQDGEYWQMNTDFDHILRKKESSIIDYAQKNFGWTDIYDISITSITFKKKFEEIKPKISSITNMFDELYYNHYIVVQLTPETSVLLVFIGKRWKDVLGIQKNTDKQIAHLQETTDKHTAELRESVEKKIADLHASLSAVLQDHDAKLDVTKQNISDINTKISTIETAISNIEKETITINNEIVKRETAMHKNLAEQRETLQNTMTSQSTSLQDSLAKREAVMQENLTKLNSMIQENVATLNTMIQENTHQIERFKLNFEKQLESMKKMLLTLESSVDDLNSVTFPNGKDMIFTHH
jgi:hypothetical protein